jgi:hypothetical protein
MASVSSLVQRTAWQRRGRSQDTHRLPERRTRSGALLGAIELHFPARFTAVQERSRRSRRCPFKRDCGSADESDQGLP